MFTILKRRICALCTDSALSVYRARFYSPAVDSVLQHHDVHSPAVDGTCVKCYDPRCIIWAEVFAPGTTASSKYAYLVSPSGFIIDLCEHIILANEIYCRIEFFTAVYAVHVTCLPSAAINVN